jgi:hypothetical protein
MTSGARVATREPFSSAPIITFPSRIVFPGLAIANAPTARARPMPARQRPRLPPLPPTQSEPRAETIADRYAAVSKNLLLLPVS